MNIPDLLLNTPWAEFINTAREYQRLDYVPRYSTIPILTPESVSTHSYWVTVYAAMIHQALDPHDTETLAAIITSALIHDSPEVESSDIVRTFKYKTHTLKNAIDEAEEEIVKDFGPSLKALVNVSKMLSVKNGKKDYVKAVVKAADFMSLHNFMVREYSRGNREITPFYQRMISDFRAMAAKSLPPFKTGEKDFDTAEFYKALADNAESVLKNGLSLALLVNHEKDHVV